MSIGVIASSAGVSGASYAPAVLADSPLAYYRLNESSGPTLVDSSGNGRNGTFGGGAFTYGVTGLVSGDSDRAINFANQTSATVVAYASWQSPTTMSIEAIIKPSSLSGNVSVASRYDGVNPSNGSWDLRIDSGKLTFYWFKPGFVSAQYVTTLVVGTRYHVVATYDGAAIRLYVNGAQVASTANSTAAIETSKPLIIAGAGSNQELNGATIDEVAFYGSALSATRVAAHMAAA